MISTKNLSVEPDKAILRSIEVGLPGQMHLRYRELWDQRSMREVDVSTEPRSTRWTIVDRSEADGFGQRLRERVAIRSHDSGWTCHPGLRW
jgi:hypothetical protein